MSYEQALAEYLRRRAEAIPNYESDGWERLPISELHRLYDIEASIYYACMAKVNA